MVYKKLIQIVKKTGFMYVFFWLLFVFNCRPGPNGPYVGWVGWLPKEQVVLPWQISALPEQIQQNKNITIIYTLFESVGQFVTFWCYKWAYRFFELQVSRLDQPPEGCFLRGWPKAPQKRFALTFVGGDLTLPRKGGPKLNLAPPRKQQLQTPHVRLHILFQLAKYTTLLRLHF